MKLFFVILLKQFNFFIFSIVLLSFLNKENLNAQVIPDLTLPINSTTNLDNNTIKIDGGTYTGRNLFHSFEQFSIPTGAAVWFNNVQSVENIISRVTGNNISVIDGLIQANGTANLFLLNPNGIIFGPHASLNIGGSFLSSTANSIQFADGSEFSSINASQTPLLSVNLPTSLRFGMNPKPIVVQGTGHNLSGGFFTPFTRDLQRTGLQVRPTKMLALVGGELNLSGGILTAEGGRIELGSVGSGHVSLIQTAESWTLGYENIDSFQDIHLTQKALVDASSDSFMTNGGSIQIQGRNISLVDGSLGLIQNLGLQSAGNINIKASESLALIGTTIDGKIPSSLVNETIIGKGGNVSIVTEQLNLQNGGQIGTRTFSQFTLDTGGNIDLSVSEAVKVIGFSPTNPDFISNISAISFLSAKAGNVLISSRQMNLVDGGFISSGTLGTGNGGNLDVTTTEAINLRGINPSNLFPSSLGVSTLSIGNSGSLTINTSTLSIQDGATVSASTGAYGDAGNVIINASTNVEVSGKNPTSINPSSVISAAPIQPIELQNLYRLPAIPTGNSGNVIINTRHLSITDGAQVNVRNDGPGNAGNLTINANSFFLDRQGEISASSVSGVEGNITLNIQNILLLRNNSKITTTSAGTGNGGNIIIDTRFLTGAGDSDITANSSSGQGGAINITAEGVFGLQIRDKLTSGNDITAISELEPALNGIVTLNVPDIDPSRGIDALPANVVDSTALVAQNPCKKGAESEFTVTGRGGLPPSINEDLSNEAVQVNLVEPTSTVGTEGQVQTPSLDTPKIQNTIVPAQGWVFNDKGEVVLTAYNPNVTEPQWLQEKSDTCPVP